MKKRQSAPNADGFRMPAEYEKQHGCLMIWPQRPGSWGIDRSSAEEAFTQIIRTIASCEMVYVFVGCEAYTWVSDLFADNSNVKVIKVQTDDSWARDTGATFVTNGIERCGIDWEFNAWGGTYDGLYTDFAHDRLVASKICEVLGDAVYDAGGFVLEGGSIHVDGEGTLITTEECLLSPGRNPTMSKREIEEKLKSYLGVTKVIWLPYGIYQDETNGHVDNFCCFFGPGKVLLAWCEDETDPQYERSALAYEILSKETDAKGRAFEIVKLPIPSKPICIEERDLANFVFEEGEDTRDVGERLAASYINFYIANDCVLVPQFGDQNDQTAIGILTACFPGRRIVGIWALDILKGGGNIHCITQQIPEV